MRARATDGQGILNTERLLRTFGYGTPVRECLFYSAGNSLTLIAQDSLQPFFEDEDGAAVQERETLNSTLCLGHGTPC